MPQSSRDLEIRHVQQLGYHNRYMEQTALHYTLAVPQRLRLAVGPVPARLIETMCASLPILATTELRIDGETRALPDLLRGPTRGFVWLTSALAAILQREIYPSIANFGSRVSDGELADFQFQFKDPTLGRVCGNAAVQLAADLLYPWDERKLDEAELQLRESIADYQQRFTAATLNQNLRAILDKADERQIPWHRITIDAAYVQLGQGCKMHRYRETLSDQESVIPTELQKNKLLSHRILGSAGLPTPKVAHVSTVEEAVRSAESVGYPVVLKPNSLAKGIGVFVGLQNANEVRAAFEEAKSYGANVILETYIPGDDHRLLVVDGKLIAAARRLPARVVGDGMLSIQQLIDEVNKDPRRSAGYATLMNNIVIDSETKRLLSLAGLTLDSVPPQGQVVELKRTANISSGGTAIDVTRAIHPDNAAMAERAAKVLGLSIAGVDFLTPDITRSYFEVGGAICEMNAAVGLRPHWVANPNYDIISPILAKTYPGDDDGRIPIAAVTGTTGKTTTVRMLAEILSQSGKTVGAVTTDEVRIGQDIVAYGDLAGISGANMVLADKRCEAAVLETARGGIIKRGLAFDRCDVAALTNIGVDHLGEYGVQSPQQMAKIKARVLRAAHKAAVLNANDPLCLAQRESVRAPRLILVAAAGPNAATEEHIEAGGEVLLLEQDQDGKTQLVMQRGRRRSVLLAAAELPSCYGGAALHNAENALFAAAMAIAMDQPLKVIRAGLKAFKPDQEHSPGRLSLIEDLDFQLLVDFAHNAAQLSVVCRFLESYRVEGRRICLFTVPGNRLDEHIVACGAAVAGSFDHYICYEREDWLRGRAPGEIAGLLQRGLAEAGVSAGAVEAGLLQDAAIRRAAEYATAGDLVAIFGSASKLSVPSFRRAAVEKLGAVAV